MQSVNYIPSHRLAAKGRRRRTNRWVVIGSAYAALLLGMYACFYALWGGGHRALADERQETDLRIQRTKQAIATVQRQLAAEEMTLEANQALADQPDWSVVLMLLAKSLDDEVVLNRCELKAAPTPAPTTPPTPVPTSAQPARTNTNTFVLVMAGYGKTVASVSRFVLELERPGLFDQVRLIKTNREPFLSGHAVNFQIECSIGAAQGDPK